MKKKNTFLFFNFYFLEANAKGIILIKMKSVALSKNKCFEFFLNNGHNAINHAFSIVSPKIGLIQS